jgi:hypothetical protein
VFLLLSIGNSTKTTKTIPIAIGTTITPITTIPIAIGTKKQKNPFPR